jgi:hypothetical protein
MSTKYFILFGRGMEVGRLPQVIDWISLTAAGHLLDYPYLFVMVVIAANKMAVIGQTNALSLAFLGRLHFAP